MVSDWDEPQDERSQAMWEEFLSGMPPEFGGDPDKFLAAYRAVLAKEQALQVYHDFYHEQYLPWQRNFDAKTYDEFLKAREQATPPAPELIAVEPPVLPSPPIPEAASEPMAAVVTETPAVSSPAVVPPDEPVWLWSDLSDVEDEAPDEAEAAIGTTIPEAVPIDDDEGVPTTGTVVPPIEPPPLAAQGREAPREEASEPGGILGHVRKLSRWFWKK